MRRSYALPAAVITAIGLITALAIRTPVILGQTQRSGPFNYIGQVDRQRATQPPSGGLPGGPATFAQVLQGRLLVSSLSCTDCHSHGKADPNDPKWLSGHLTTENNGAFQIGPFKTYAKNLTPDKDTGIGSHSDRQIFNTLRFGLDPEDTPDVVITSNIPGQGNFPANPHYLAPPMPWPSFRHRPDADLWAIVAYLKHGIKAVNNKVSDSEGPPDHWASTYILDKIGPYPLPPYPGNNEAFNP